MTEYETGMTAREKRLKRLAIRSWRRGTKEMDLILGRFWDDEGPSLDEATLATYEVMLSENDHDLYLWVSDQAEPPDTFKSLIARLRTQPAEDQ